MRVGCAGCDITPDRPLRLEGYGGRDHPAEGALDPLEARAIVVDDGDRQAAILMVDVCGLVRASTQRIRALVELACDIAPERVMVTYSHTHSAPTTTPYVNQPPDPTYLTWLEQTLSELVATAQRRLQPALLAVGEGLVDFNVNRRLRTPEGMAMRANPHGLVDRRVRLLRFERADAPHPLGTLGGQALPQTDPLAVLFSYVCHPTVLGGANYRYSSDYPGAARRFVEQAFPASDGGQPACLVGFLPGCFGDVRPHLLAPDGRFREGTVHELRLLGRRLGSAVVQAAEASTAEPVARIAMATREVTLPYAALPTVGDLRAALAGPRRYWAEALLERLERDGHLPDAETSEVQVLRLGRHWLVALPGETTLEIGMAIERSLTELGLARPGRGDMTVSIGYANDYVAYLPSASLMTEGGYEVTSWHEYLRCGPFTPDLEGRLVQTAIELALGLGVAA